MRVRVCMRESVFGFFFIFFIFLYCFITIIFFYPLILPLNYFTKFRVYIVEPNIMLNTINWDEGEKGKGWGKAAIVAQSEIEIEENRIRDMNNFPKNTNISSLANAFPMAKNIVFIHKSRHAILTAVHAKLYVNNPKSVSRERVCRSISKYCCRLDTR